jgi:hypothetical protein
VAGERLPSTGVSGLKAMLDRRRQRIMLAALIRFSLTQRLLMLVLTVMFIGAGVQAFLGLPIDAFPDVSTTQVKLILKARA